MIAAVGIVINVTVNLLLIPRMMACGSAVASFCTQFIVAVLQFVFAWRIIGFPLSSIPWLRYLIFLAVFIPVAAIAPRVLHCHVLWSLIIVAGVAVLLGFATGLLRLKNMKTMLK